MKATAGNCDRKFRSPTIASMMGAAWTSFLFLALMATGSTDSVAAIVLCFLIAAIFLGLIVRAVGARVKVNEKGIDRRGFFRSTFISWSEVESVECVIEPGILSWKLAQLTLATEKTMLMREFTQLRADRGKVTEFVDLVENCLQSNGEKK